MKDSSITIKPPHDDNGWPARNMLEQDRLDALMRLEQYPAFKLPEDALEIALERNAGNIASFILDAAYRRDSAAAKIHLDGIFSNVWHNDIPSMMRIWEKVPPVYKRTFDIQNALAEKFCRKFSLNIQPKKWKM